jgi:hypothetical protein
VQHHGLLLAVAEDVVARGTAYMPWAPRLADTYAAAGFGHHLLFEALAVMALRTQGRSVHMCMLVCAVCSCVFVGGVWSGYKLLKQLQQWPIKLLPHLAF